MILTLCIDKQPKTNPSNELKTYEINIGNRLCSYDDVYDELIITLNDVNQLEGIIKRRCNIDRFDIITKLQQEEIQTLEIPEITLFEGTNYVYLQDFDYLNMKIEYLTNVEMNKHFAKTEEFNSALVLTAQEFNLKLSKKLDGEEFTHANIALKLNDDTSEALIDADKINMRGKTFDLTVDEMAIESTNFSVSKEGHMRATSGEIGGFNLDAIQFYNNISGKYDYTDFDSSSIKAFVLGVLGLSYAPYNIYDYNEDGVINGLDALKIAKIIGGIDENTKIITGKVEINSDNPKNCMVVYDNYNTPIVSIGLGGVNTNLLTATNIVCGHDENGALKGTMINGETGRIYINNPSGIVDIDPGNKFWLLNGGLNSGIQMNIPRGEISCAGDVYCNSVIQTSLKEKKKNFERLENALDIIKNIDIYKYNMKEDKDTDKKHIGFVIGDKFNYSKEVTSKNNDGVDIYALASVCCKAIQEQQKIIEQLQEKIKRLESDK